MSVFGVSRENSDQKDFKYGQTVQHVRMQMPNEFKIKDSNIKFYTSNKTTSYHQGSTMTNLISVLQIVSQR